MSGTDDYTYYEELFNPPSRAERDWLAGKPVGQPRKKRAPAEVEEMADTVGLDGRFDLTYRAAKHERVWLFESLRGFFDDHLITDVLAQIKGGKEANVYRCAAHPDLGVEFLAAKVYRPRIFRTLRNDYQYRQGREFLSDTGRPVNPKDQRLKKALEQGTDLGRNVAQTSWLMHEYTAMGRLYDAGGAVPEPVAAGENALLMGYWGDAGMAAPTLNTINLDRTEAQALFDEAWRNVELMLQHGLIHGDLSAYNLLYWQGQIALIDFPQVIDPVENDFAHDILRRDVQRLCDYFAAQGVACDAEALTGDLWGRHVGERLKAKMADFSMAQYAQSEAEIAAAEPVAEDEAEPAEQAGKEIVFDEEQGGVD